MTARLPIESNRTEGSQALANSGWRLRVALTRSARCRAMTAICANRTGSEQRCLSASGRFDLFVEPSGNVRFLRT
jgi:hypothetical protein